MELKKSLTHENRGDIAGILDSEGFWYALNDGGYVKPEDVLENQADIDAVTKAIETLRDFEDSLPNLDDEEFNEE